jgi:glycosyltransferase involved in cell wall biosynthesis
LFARIMGFKVIWIGKQQHINAFVSILIKQIAHMCNSIIAPNQAIEAQYLKTGIPNNKIHLIYPSCEIHSAQPKQTQELILCCDGSIAIEDGLGMILKGVAHAHEILKQCKLIIGGNIKDKTRIEWIVQELGLKQCVQIIPSKTNHWSKECDVYIMMNNTDTHIPVSLLQAMSYGLAVIGVDILRNYEFVEKQKQGMLLEPNPENLSQAIISLSRNPGSLREYQQYNYMFAQERFSKSKFNEKVAELF